MSLTFKYDLILLKLLFFPGRMHFAEESCGGFRPKFLQVKAMKAEE